MSELTSSSVPELDRRLLAGNRKLGERMLIEIDPTDVFRDFGIKDLLDEERAALEVQAAKYPAPVRMRTPHSDALRMIEGKHRLDLVDYTSAYQGAAQQRLTELGHATELRVTWTDPFQSSPSSVVDPVVADLHQYARTHAPLPQTSAAPDWSTGTPADAVRRTGVGYAARALAQMAYVEEAWSLPLDDTEQRAAALLERTEESLRQTWTGSPIAETDDRLIQVVGPREYEPALYNDGATVTGHWRTTVDELYEDRMSIYNNWNDEQYDDDVEDFLGLDLFQDRMRDREGREVTPDPVVDTPTGDAPQRTVLASSAVAGREGAPAGADSPAHHVERGTVLARVRGAAERVGAAVRAAGDFVRGSRGKDTHAGPAGPGANVFLGRPALAPRDSSRPAGDPAGRGDGSPASSARTEQAPAATTSAGTPGVAAEAEAEGVEQDVEPAWRLSFPTSAAQAVRDGAHTPAPGAARMTRDADTARGAGYGDL
jgi:hypothetical protein